MLCCSIFSFLCYALLIVVCPFVLFLLAIVLPSVFLLFTVLNYHLGVFKRFLEYNYKQSQSIWAKQHTHTHTQTMEIINEVQ
jgi:hypothetical protein